MKTIVVCMKKTQNLLAETVVNMYANARITILQRQSLIRTLVIGRKKILFDRGTAIESSRNNDI